MISAEQARNMEIELSGSDLILLEKIEGSILNAIADMRSNCWCYYTLSSRVIIELKNLGYDVKNETSQRDGVLYNITW